MDKKAIIGSLIIGVSLYLLINSHLILTFKLITTDTNKEKCIDSGYTYIDKQCLDVKVIEL